MTTLYSNTTKGFYDEAEHARSGMTWPSDLVAINNAEEILLRDAINAGKQIELIDGRWAAASQVHGNDGLDRSLKMQIAAIESTQGRALREIALGIEGGVERLQEIERAIASIRQQLSTA